MFFWNWKSSCYRISFQRLVTKNIHKLVLTSIGHNVFAASRSTSSLKSLVDKGITAIELDPTNSESIHLAQDQISKLTGGTLDILVNNA